MNSFGSYAHWVGIVYTVPDTNLGFFLLQNKEYECGHEEAEAKHSECAYSKPIEGFTGIINLKKGRE